MKVGGVRTVGPSTVRVPGGMLLPAASFADQAIMRAIVLVAIARAGDVVRS